MGSWPGPAATHRALPCILIKIVLSTGAEVRTEPVVSRRVRASSAAYMAKLRVVGEQSVLAVKLKNGRVLRGGKGIIVREVSGATPG
jgi:hypothetical protein